jgi:hypothetical protein
MQKVIVSYEELIAMARGQGKRRYRPYHGPPMTVANRRENGVPIPSWDRPSAVAAPVAALAAGQWN